MREIRLELPYARYTRDEVVAAWGVVANGRLREVVGDELLVRSGQGVEPTPRALALWPSVRDALMSRWQTAPIVGEPPFYDTTAGAGGWFDNAPGTPWADVPMNWTCPECGARKEDFEMVAI